MILNQPLPEYDNPPVTEVVIAVEFTPISGWIDTYAGLFWSKINERFPITEVHPAIVNGPDPLDRDELFQPSQAKIEWVQLAPSRSWFISADRLNIIQLQHDRFIFNWRKVTGKEIYPRFERTIMPIFEQEFAAFKQFVSDIGFANLTVRRCELSYINEIAKGSDWNVLEEALKFFKYSQTESSAAFLPSLETINFSGAFKMQNGAGRLSYLIAHALRQRDMEQILQFGLTARGPVGSTPFEISEWVKLGREWIVRGFTDLTTPMAHEKWGRTR